jgi:hypothetical protein
LKNVMGAAGPGLVAGFELKPSEMKSITKMLHDGLTLPNTGGTFTTEVVYCVTYLSRESHIIGYQRGRSEVNIVIKDRR